MSFNSLCEIPPMKSSEMSPFMVPFNSLCEIQENIPYKQYHELFSFNSLCEIPYWRASWWGACPLTFNSLCEIPWRRDLFRFSTYIPFQFSLWDSVKVANEIVEIVKTFNSLCEILHRHTHRQGGQKHNFQFSLWDSPWHGPDRWIRRSFNSLCEIRLTGPISNSKRYGELSILFVRFRQGTRGCLPT